MRNLSETIARISELRHAVSAQEPLTGSKRLQTFDNFGPNPGALQGHIYAPANLPEAAALVVVLHGCTQTAEGYNLGSGWSDMADRHGFAVLFPEQSRQNNANLCFNWFAPQDSRRGQGEAASIRNMIAAALEIHALDPARVYVTGLSAGGAMASVMMATYPEVFAGGAIIAGLPYGCASSVPEAFDRMRGQGVPDRVTLADQVRRASDHAGPWPTVSIWHGSADTIVSPTNADALVSQWGLLHQVGVKPTQVETVRGHARWVWQDHTGRPVIEAFSIAGMGHGTPLHTAGNEGCGQAGAFLLEANISSTHHICQFWGLLEDRRSVDDERQAERSQLEPLPTLVSEPEMPPEPQPHRAKRRRAHAAPAGGAGVSKIIEDALRAAGLMR